MPATHAVSLGRMLRPQMLLFLTQLRTLHLVQWQSPQIKFEKVSKELTAQSEDETPR